MKLVRFGPLGHEKPGVLTGDDEIVDVSSIIRDYDSDFFARGGIDELRQALDGTINDLPKAEPNARIGAPVSRPGKIVAIGLNYSDHALEASMEPPPEPVVFFKAVTAFSGPYDPVEIPRGSSKTDWEVELAFVIGKRAQYVAKENAEHCIAGYAIMNDVSEREFQIERSGQWVKGKSHDTFAPFGPILATPDELGPLEELALELDVNGEARQRGSVKSMIFKPAFLVHYLSRFMTLEPGDIITTGTPPGVGMGMKPPCYLKPGDTMQLRISGLGEQKQVCVSA